MLRAIISTRCYNTATSKKLPLVRNANARLGREIKRRNDAEAQPRVSNTNRQFEPFPCAVTEANRVELFRRLITPLHDISYEEQLVGKQAHCRNSIRYLAQQIYKAGTPVRLDIRRLPCPVKTIVPSPEIYKYRNKTEYNIWRGVDGKLTVGHNVFSIGKHGDTICVEPDGCLVTKDDSIKLVSVFQEFMRSHSKLGCCFNLGQEGGWRRIIVRQNLADELMAIGFLSPRTLKVSQVVEDRDGFRNFMVQRCGEMGINLKSLYYQPAPHSRAQHADCPYELLNGEAKLTETVGKYKFAFSPESFMHENTKGAELLYEEIRKTLKEAFNIAPELPDKPLIIQNQCGGGALTAFLSECAEHIVALDLSGPATVDAAENAKANGIDNVKFVNSNFEIALEKILEKYQDVNTLVVCDVKKAGLHRSVVQSLRLSRDVNRLVYIYPKADHQKNINDLVELCSKLAGSHVPPFAPVLVTPVDLYPHTESCPIIVALERLPK